jgi:hypothetical protein
MRYFTPELWVQYQDIGTREKFEAAHAAWNQAVAAYETNLSHIDAQLPEQLRSFLRFGTLHDALLMASWRDGTSLSLLVRPAAPSSGLIKLEYGLVSDPVIDRSALPAGWRSARPEWMYDEVGLDTQASVGQPADGPVFTHDILLQDGVELRLRFRNFTCSRVTPLDALGQLSEVQTVA